MPSGEPISLEILHDMLGYLDPGVERDDWRDIIAAIHAAPVPGDDDKSGRRQLAQDWSEGAHNYDGPEDVDRTFDTMLPGRGVTVATLIKRARAAGYDGPISIAEAERIRVWSAIAAEQAEADCWSKRTGAQPPTDFVFPKEFIEHARQQTAEAERRLNEAFPASDMEANRNV
jgi:hypothetical protein